MSARFCPYCGQPVVAGGTFCPSCGSAVGGTPPLARAPGASPTPAMWGVPPSAPYPPGYYLAVGGPTSASRDADLRALSSVTLAAILALVGTVVGLVSLLGTSATTFLSVSANPSGTSVGLSLSALYLLAASAGVGLIFSALELYFYRQAFQSLAPHDPRFSTPATLVLLALVALLIIVLVGVVALVLLYRAILCAGSGNPITSTCVDFSGLLGILGVLAVAAVLALVGYIGLLVGIWRLGTRYGDGMFKVGAVLLLFPVLNLVAVILILLAAHSTRAKLGAGPSTAPFG